MSRPDVNRGSAPSAAVATPAPTGSGRRGWLVDAVIAGFVATGVATAALVVAYLAAAGLGDPRGDALRQWMWGLTHNPVVSFSQASPAVAVAAHIVVGLVLAIVYARWLAGRLSGVVWGLLLGVLSLVVFLPAAGAGFLGLGLNAGPLPIVGNLLLNALYGFTLGRLYDPAADRPDTGEDATYSEPAEAQAMAHSEAFGAVGIFGGLVVGALLGGMVAAVVQPVALDDTAGWTIAVAIAGILAGGAVGAIIGSFAGLPQLPLDPAEVALGPDPFERNVLPFVIIPGLALLIAAIVVSFGSTLLNLAVSGNKLIPVAAALAGTLFVGLGAAVLARRHESPSEPPLTHTGH